MAKEHSYKLTLKWTGNTGHGTSDYKSYERSHIIQSEQKVDIAASSDPAFRGDKTKHNPEELLIASLSGCHMLWFLHLCADAGVIVIDYEDHPTGTMIELETGGGRFKEVTLHPVVTLQNKEFAGKLNALHQRAHDLCFIANSVNFEVTHQPTAK
ncbi:MAG: OsmC family protein [Bacteroidetes bacterium]|nr:OsmC family protein [Bacteroidota bacterium]